MTRSNLTVSLASLCSAAAAQTGFEFRDPAERRVGRVARMAESKAGKLLEVIEVTDFLQAVSLLHTAAGKAATETGQGGPGVPAAISCTRQSILDLPLAG